MYKVAIKNGKHLQEHSCVIVTKTAVRTMEKEKRKKERKKNWTRRKWKKERQLVQERLIRKSKNDHDYNVPCLYMYGG